MFLMNFLCSLSAHRALRDVQLSTEEQRILALLLKRLFSKLPQGGGLEKVAHGVLDCHSC